MMIESAARNASAHELAQIVAASAISVMRLTGTDAVLWGTVLQSRRSVHLAILQSDQSRIHLSNLDRPIRTGIVTQGRVGAVAGVLAYRPSSESWYWFPWPCLC